ncbi:D-2-hydroxyacid dehydrogenase [Variovorax saccharolyticus]|uniref:D-2-hydroxyacid dehydrogenase n=1 Tax=Variovorax saccharolyticus TaxID=3053516 RepID=UPI00257739B6|nr:D-2-hydroxyacid dehydrogenase [Variovorax sp. J31P216]MDM0023974.1 D-2-hydroxyacid dehydrogenase [Variovorax sp. J31P216]
MSQAPLRILLSEAARQAAGAAIAEAVGSRGHRFVAPAPGVDADIAFVSRDVTGLSTKHAVLPATQAFHDAMRGARSLRWVHVHSAGADRPVYVELRARGVAISSSSGANAAVVAQTALAGLLALARRFPQLMRAQRAGTWAPLIGSGLPRDLAGQTAVIVGWGPIGRQLAASLQLLGLRIVVVRSSAAAAAAADVQTLAFEDIRRVLPQADWLLLACPLTQRTRGLIDAEALALLPPGAHLVNVARGELLDEPALVEALAGGRLGGAFLDVFAQEPLPPDSPIWQLDNVIATPHSAGFSDGNEARVTALFIDNLGHWLAGGSLRNQVP